MRLEGRLALGLDEFMLRPGHLKVLLAVLRKTYGNRATIARHLAENLTKPFEIDAARVQDVGVYLARKKLCVVVRPDGAEIAAHPKARYSHLRVSMGDGDTVRAVTDNRGDAVKIWYQDLALADRRTRSKVGAVTADTREVTNKSGVSHLVDWAVILGIASKRLGLTAVGRALATVCDQIELPSSGSAAINPYVIGSERLVFAWMLFMSDGDVLARLICHLERVEELSKSDACDLAMALASEMREEVARAGTAATVAAAGTVRGFQNDLGLERARRRPSNRPTSTVWHRISSRLESLVDVGFLEKADRLGHPRQFDYCYRPTSALKRASEGLRGSGAPSEWVDARLAETIAPESTEKSGLQDT